MRACAANRLIFLHPFYYTFPSHCCPSHLSPALLSLTPFPRTAVPHTFPPHCCPSHLSLTLLSLTPFPHTAVPHIFPSRCCPSHLSLTLLSRSCVRRYASNAANVALLLAELQSSQTPSLAGNSRGLRSWAYTQLSYILGSNPLHVSWGGCNGRGFNFPPYSLT